MGITLNRHLGDESGLICGQYTRLTESGRAAIKCPLCGLTFSLPSHLRVELDGRAVPALKCPQTSCPLFDYVTLESYWEEFA